MKINFKKMFCMFLALALLVTGSWGNRIDVKAARTSSNAAGNGVQAAGSAVEASDSSVVRAAGNGVKKLTVGKTYKSWDIDGDGSKDSIVIKVPKDDDYYIDSAKVFVNGKNRYTFKINDYGVMELHMVSLETGKNLVFMRFSGANEDGPGRLLSWSDEKGKLVNIFNVSNAAGIAGYGYHLYVKPISVSQDKIKISFFNYNYLVGCIEFSFEYRYADGKMKRVSDSGSIIMMRHMDSKNQGSEETRYLTAARSIKVYKKPGSTASSNLQQTIKKNKKVKFTGVWTDGKQFWMKVTVNSKTGYLKCYRYDDPRSYTEYFKDLWFAG